MPSEAVRAVLLRAAERVERGWCQGRLMRENQVQGIMSGHPEFCIIGAIHHVPDTQLAFRAVLTVERMLGVASLATWNDAYKRTQAEVVAALRRAAGEGGDPKP